MDGDALYGLVEGYASLGPHRTGSAGDVATRSWLHDELSAVGATSTESPYTFPRFEVRHHRVTVNGRQVASEPLWYAGEGTWDTTEVMGHIATVGSPHSVVLDGDARIPVVVATEGAGGRLVVPNRPPNTSIDRPHALVAGAVAQELDGASIRFEAELVRGPGTSANVEAWFGPVVPDPVLLVTPISGWFACAGERATGIAVAFALALELAATHSVRFVGTTGHELGHLGVEELVRSMGGTAPCAVIHVGASVGAGEPGPGGLTFGTQRWAMTSLPATATDALAAAVATAGYPQVTSRPDDWYGEGVVLRHLGAPLLSFLGLFELFHTPQDLPAASTSPSLLTRASDGVRAGAQAFLDTVSALG